MSIPGSGPAADEPGGISVTLYLTIAGTIMATLASVHCRSRGLSYDGASNKRRSVE